MTMTMVPMVVLYNHNVDKHDHDDYDNNDDGDHHVDNDDSDNNDDDHHGQLRREFKVWSEAACVFHLHNWSKIDEKNGVITTKNYQIMFYRFIVMTELPSAVSSSISCEEQRWKSIDVTAWWVWWWHMDAGDR